MNFKVWDPLKTWKEYRPPKKYQRVGKKWAVCEKCKQEFITKWAKVCIDCQKRMY